MAGNSPAAGDENKGKLDIKSATVEQLENVPGRHLDYILIHADARNVTEKAYKVVLTAEGVEE